MLSDVPEIFQLSVQSFATLFIVFFPFLIYTRVR